jgi:hypothetical protein
VYRRKTTFFVDNQSSLDKIESPFPGVAQSSFFLRTTGDLPGMDFGEMLNKDVKGWQRRPFTFSRI